MCQSGVPHDRVALGTQRDIVTGSLYLAANMHDGLPSLPGDVVTGGAHARDVSQWGSLP